jgi:hypothetical protein
MKHLNKYIDFKVNEGWLSDRLSEASEGVKTALSDFAKPFENIAKKVKTDWQEEFNAENVRKDLIDSLGKSFDSMIKAMDKMEVQEDVQTIFDEIDQALVQFNDQLGKEIDNMVVKESIKSYNDFFTVNEAQESVMAGLKAAIDNVIQQAKDKLSEVREDYLKIFEQEDDAEEVKALDTMKEEAKEFFKKISKEIENNIKGLDIKTIVDDAKAKVETEKSTNQEDYQPGQLLKYTKKRW